MTKPDELAAAIKAAKDAERDATLADKKSKREDEASVQAQERSKAFLVDRDAHYVECGRQIIIIKKLYAAAKINRPWKAWIAEELAISYSTVARRMKDAKKPGDADRRRETDRNQKSQKNDNSETARPAPVAKPDVIGEPIDPTDETPQPEVKMTRDEIMADALMRDLKRTILALSADDRAGLLEWLFENVSSAAGEAPIGASPHPAATPIAETQHGPVEAPVQPAAARTWYGKKPPVACNHKDGLCGYEKCAGIGCCQVTAALPLGTPQRKAARTEAPAVAL